MQMADVMADFQSGWAWLTIVGAAVLLILTAWGTVLLAIWPRLRISRAPIPSFCESLLVGCLVFSLAGLLGLLLGITVTRIAVSGSVTAGLLGVVLSRRHQRGQALFHATPPGSAWQWSLAAVFLVVAGSLLWSIFNLRALAPSGNDLVLVPWQDTFFHARLIGNFARFNGDVTTLHGEPLAPYHYGGYVVSALVERLMGAPAIQVATSVYPVVGMLLTGAAMLVLAHAAAGSGAAFLAVFILFFLPDPSCWWPHKDRWTSYFFFQQVGIGGAYAVAMLGLSLALALQGFRVRSRLLCVVSLCVFLLAGLFKVQIVLAYGIFFLFGIWNAPLPSRRARIACTAVLFAAFALALTVLGKIPNAPTSALSTANLADYLRPVLKLFYLAPGPTPWALAFTPLAVAPLALAIFGTLFPLAGYLGWSLRKDMRCKKRSACC